MIITRCWFISINVYIRENIGHMERINVTIAIPIYNVAGFIKQSLQSALNQTIDNYEILILNDCSTDDSVEVIQKLAENADALLTIYNSKQNCGVGVMRNKAIELAQGEYLYFLDSDDIMIQNCLEIMLSEARKYDSDLVIGSHIDVRGDVERMNKEVQHVFLNKDEFALYAFDKRYGYAGGVWNKLFKVDLLRRCNIMFPEYRVGEDVPFIFRLITQVNRVVLIDEVTYKYIIRPGSLSQENPRTIIPKVEIDTHMLSRFLLKKILSDNVGKPFYMPMLAVVMDYCIDTVRVVIEKRNYFEEPISHKVIMDMMSNPASFHQIVQFGNKRTIFNWLLCQMPFPVVFSYFYLRKKLKDWKSKR